jgi:hypothetical protein
MKGFDATLVKLAMRPISKHEGSANGLTPRCGTGKPSMPNLQKGMLATFDVR